MNTNQSATMRHLLPRAAAAAFSLSCVLAQTAPGGTLSSPASIRGTAPIHSGASDEGQPYGVWAVGRDYKVGFADGVQFVPYIGRTDGPAPSWRWRTKSARVGELELATAASRFSHGEWRAEYDLGGVVEAYDVRPEGVEQTFVLRDRPRSTGDLVIRGAVDSVLRAQQSDGAWSFVDERGTERVRYGAATAVDAFGNRRAMSTTFVDGGLELRLDGAWLAGAAFPVVVDPLVAAVTVANGQPVGDVVVAHDPLGTKNLWFANVRWAGNDADVLLYRSDEDGHNGVLVFSDVSASWSSIEPSLGVSRPGASTILAYTRHISSGDLRRVRLHVHDRTDLGFEGTVYLMSAPGSRNQWRPTVGSELSPISYSSVLLAYQVEGSGSFVNGIASEIHGAVVSCNGTGSVTAQFPIAAEAGVDFERPSLAKVAIGPTRVWTIAYQRYSFAAGGFEWDVGTRRIDQSNIVGPEYLVDAGNADVHEMAPRLAGIDDRFMVFATASDAADTVAKPGGTNGHRIRGTRVDWVGGAPTMPHGSLTLQSNSDARLELGGADLDWTTASHWALSFRSNATENVYLRVLGFTGAQLSSHDVDSPSTGLGTSKAGGVCFLGSEGSFAVAYGIDDPGVGSDLRLRTHEFGAPNAYHFGFGCTTTAMNWTGSRWIGSEFSGLTFTNAPTDSVSFALVALAPAALQMYGFGGVHDGCWLYVPISGPDFVMLTSAIVGANGFVQIPLPEWLESDLIYFQGVTLDGATGEFFTTNRLAVPTSK
ncbi:MAG: hypothetical protein JNK78_14340 [Planctomycetes bacterium]|nr:hypothetical protein [Planctomycetota bacterium]